MKKIILLPLILLCSFIGVAQTLEKPIGPIDSDPHLQAPIVGSWSWNFPDNSKQFEMEIIEINGSFKGSHCSIFYNGKFIDCSDTDLSINLTRTSTNIFEGTLKSGYSHSIGKIKLIYDMTVHFILLEEPSQIFFLPKDVILE